MPNRFLDGFLALGKKVNRTKGEPYEETEEGIVGEQISELSLEKKDEDLILFKRSRSFSVNVH